MRRHWGIGVIVLGLGCLALPAGGSAGDKQTQDWPVLLKEDFEKGADRWQPADPSGWKIEALDGNHVFHQFKKESNYKPPHRSPFHMALLKDIRVSSFQLDAKVKSTVKDYAHRDVCLFFGYQDAAHL